MKKFASWLVALFCFLVAVVFAHLAGSVLWEYYTSDSPEPLVIYKIPHSFEGRILPGHRVSPMTFTVSYPFEEALEWGESAILSFGFTQDSLESDPTLEVWMPDSRSVGIFRYSQLSLPTRPWLDDDKHFYKVGKLVFDEDTREITASPTKIRMDDRRFSWVFTLVLLCLFNLIVGWVCASSIRRS